MLGTVAHPEGITNPPIDDLLEKVDSKYGLVVEAAKRARQINSYALQLEDNQFEFFGPLVDVTPGEKALGVALREIAQDKLEVIPGDVARARRAEAEAARAAAEEDMFADLDLDVAGESASPVSVDDIQF
ncbi:DNA-directed RNA polymerase subunit omega [Actinomyces vulturis]|uniref:DNA-directed RNA polymerase subunit omega n=1 Tax=Actinomyces vulturis TaxID=1857645 RepID=UPI000830F7DD|nr:DNA-directed RNA polymerase subunit omega [Actinomyces vulturis]